MFSFSKWTHIISLSLKKRKENQADMIIIEMKMWSSQLWLRFKQSQSKPEKCFQGFNGIQNHVLFVSTAVLPQLSYEDPYVASRPICGIHRTRERNETMNIKTYEYYVSFLSRVRWIPQIGLLPKYRVFMAQLVEHCSANAEAMGSNPVEALKTFFGLTLQLLKSQLPWSHLHFIRMSAVHIICIRSLLLMDLYSYFNKNHHYDGKGLETVKL